LILLLFNINGCQSGKIGKPNKKGEQDHFQENKNLQVKLLRWKKFLKILTVKNKEMQQKIQVCLFRVIDFNMANCESNAMIEEMEGLLIQK